MHECKVKLAKVWQSRYQMVSLWMPGTIGRKKFPEEPRNETSFKSKKTVINQSVTIISVLD